MSFSLADEGLPLAPDVTPDERGRAAPPPRAAAPPPAARPAPPPAARPAPPPAPPPAVARQAPPAPAPTSEDQFRPSGTDSGSINLALDVVPPDPMLSTASLKQEQDVVVPRCPRHDVPRRGGRCALCEAEEKALKGRLFGGKLQRSPPLRIGSGVAIGVAIGWVLTGPMAKKAERAVAYMREEADRERARPTDEAQAHARALDNQADEEAQSAFFRTLGVWALIAAAVTGGWYRLT
jgi:hypothetical protein